MIVPVIVVDGGIVQNVDGVDQYIVLDYDSLEGGSCPYCGEGLERYLIATKKCGECGHTEDMFVDNWCLSCKIDWDNVPDDIAFRVRTMLEMWDVSCDKCGDKFTLDEWYDRHTPDEEILHSNCCPEC